MHIGAPVPPWHSVHRARAPWEGGSGTSELSRWGGAGGDQRGLGFPLLHPEPAGSCPAPPASPPGQEGFRPSFMWGLCTGCPGPRAQGPCGPHCGRAVPLGWFP